MVEYSKPWLSLDEQVDRLAARGVDVGPRDVAIAQLRAIGYYRLTGYLYPFRHSERFDADDGKSRVRVPYECRSATCSAELPRSLTSIPRTL